MPNSASPNRTVLITGGSSGIGFELARLFARDRYEIILVAKDADRLAEAQSTLQNEFQVAVQIIALDLSTPSAATALFDRVRRLDRSVDVLVNNAGFGVYGFFSETDLRAEVDMIAVNVTLLTELTKLFLPAMLRRGQGRILNVASTAAFQPGPLMAVYYASKAYVLSFSCALANETQGTGVTVTTLCPGPTRTRFQIRAELTETRLFNGVVMSAESVAACGYRGLQRGTLVVVPGLWNKLLALGSRISPRRFVVKVARRLQENRRK